MPWHWMLSLFLLGSYALALVAFVHALLHSRHPQSALGWAVAIMLLPLAGSIAYFLFGISRVDSRASRLMAAAATRRSDFLIRDRYEQRRSFPKPRFELADRDILRVGEGKPGTLMRLGGNTITPLFNGDEAYPAMLGAIRLARREVFLSTFIFKGTVWGEAFAEALREAHARGVDVRVLVDGVGTFFRGSNPWKKLCQQGVPLYRFLPPRLFPPQFSINLRNHRKVLICDETAFTGGMNISDNNVLTTEEKYHIQDLHFCCHGPVVSELREAFLMDWTFIIGKDDELPLLTPGKAGDMDCRIVMDGPGTPVAPLQDLLCGVIGCAREQATIITPYFLPPRELLSALSCAAARGVEIRVILPSEINHPMVAWAGRRILPLLLKNGIKVYHQPPPFAHTKLVLIDNLYACLGSANLDPRSLSLNYELNMEVFCPDFNRRLTRYANALIMRSRKVSWEDIQNRPLLLRLRDALFWIFSPYM